MPEATEVQQQEQTAETAQVAAETQTTETQETVTTAETTAEEGQVQENTAEAGERVAEDPYLLKTVVDGQEEVWDLKDEERRAKAIEFIQKGVDYGKRQQGLSEWEKANQQKLQMADQLMSDPNTIRFIIAKQLGYDPNMVLGNPQPPDPNLRDTNPDVFWQQHFYYDQAQKQKTAFDTAVNGMITVNAQTANNAMFEKTRIQNNLSETEYQAVRNFVSQNMLANPTGMYSETQIGAALKAVVDRTASDKLTTANRVQQTLKKAAGTQPQKQITQRQEKLTEQQKKDREFLDYVQRFTGKK